MCQKSAQYPLQIPTKHPANQQAEKEKNFKRMSSNRLVKMNFRGVSRNIVLSTPVTIVGLQAAVASTFGVDLPERSTTRSPHGPGKDLCFTFKDEDGDGILFDTDAELNLALKVCPKELEISATESEIARGNGEVADIYEFAARNLRERHGVTSMTKAKLSKTLPVFKFGPRRLVDRGLSPAHLLNPTTPTPIPAAGDSDCDGDGDLGVTGDFDEDESDQNQQQGSSEHSIHPKRMSMYERIHAVLLDAGVEIRPGETRPLLKALGLLRCRLVGLGLIPRDDLRVSPEPGSELERTFVVAARNLREHHSVPSMTPEMLVHTMAVLELRPRRLVGTGLAPKGSLRDERQEIAHGGGQSSGDGEDDGYDSFEPLDDSGADESDYEREGSNPIHMAFIRKGIEIKPQEAMALLLALRVAPARLAKLNMVNSKQLRRFVRRFRRKARRSGAQEHRRGPASGVHVSKRTGKF